MPADDTPLLPKSLRSDYYRDAASWSADINGALRASRRIAWIVALAALGVAACEGLAIAVMMPLKTVVPYTILVDRQTGYVETIKGLQPGTLSQNSAVTQSFLVQYVMARETFDVADLRENYHKVMIWSDNETRAQYQHAYARTNPASPLNLYQPTTTLATTIKSVSLLTPSSALIRFDTTRTEGSAVAGEQRSYAAVIVFHYSGSPLSMGDRFLNPLGFQVTHYRRDAETVAGNAVHLDGAPGGAR